LVVDDNSVSSKTIPNLENLISVSYRNNKYQGFYDFHQLLYETKDRSNEIKERLRTQKCTDIQFICQTSGSTGVSKSALWDHRPPLATANSVAKYLAYSEIDSYLNLSPLFPNGGIFAVNLSLAYAGTP